MKCFLWVVSVLSRKHESIKMLMQDGNNIRKTPFKADCLPLFLGSLPEMVLRMTKGVSDTMRREERYA
jgi:hypothetical protein